MKAEITSEISRSRVQEVKAGNESRRSCGAIVLESCWTGPASGGVDISLQNYRRLEALKVIDRNPSAGACCTSLMPKRGEI